MSLHEQLISLYTIIRKEVSRFLRIWPQTLLPSAVTMTLYFVIFGAFIGSQVQPINGYSYMQFIVPGLIMMAVITNAYSNVSSSFFGQKFQRAIEELLVSPTPNWVIIWGYVLGGVARGILVGLIVTLVSLFFVPLVIHNIFLVLLVIALTAIVFSLAGMVNAVYARKFDDVSIVPTFVLTPLTYLGGVFYSVSVLPEFWQWVSKANPILYMINVFRFGFLGISDIAVPIGVGMLLLFTVVLYGAIAYLLRKGIGMKH